MGVAIVLVVLIVGSLLFHLLSPWYFTPIASNWGAIDDTIRITFWVTGVGLRHREPVHGVCGVPLSAPQRKRGRITSPRTRSSSGGCSASPPSASRRCWRRGCSCGRSSSTCRRTRPRSRRWASSGTGCIASRARTASSARSSRARQRRTTRSGVNPTIPTGSDDIVVDQPGGAPAGRQAGQGRCCARTTSCTTSRSRRSASRWISCPASSRTSGSRRRAPGSFDLLCEELCGVGHFAMRGRVIVEDDAAFQAWLASSRHSRRPWLRPAPRCRGRPGAIRGMRGLPRRAGRGQCGDATRRSSPVRAAGT